MKKIIISALAIAAIASCSKTEIEQGGDASDAIVFGGSIEIETKRTDASTVFDNGEVIGVFGYSMTTAAPTSDFTADMFMNNVPFTYDGAKFAPTSTTVRWHANRAHNFYAYYPTTLAVTNAATGATAPLELAPVTGIDAANDVMVAQLETPIYDGTTDVQNLTFRHALSKVRFKIKRESDETMNAVLSDVEFRMKSKAGTVNLTNGTVAKTPGFMKLSKDLTEAPITATTAEVDVPGNWMVLPLDDMSDIIMTINGKPMRAISTNATITTQPGKITTVIIIIRDDRITFTTSIDPWGTDSQYVPGVKPVYPGPIIMYGNLPYNQVGTIPAYTLVTYNDKYGAGATNGTYRANAAAAYAGELPYCNFEVATTDAGVGNKNWTTLQGAAATHFDNICVHVHGEGWRLPRLSELKLMYENRDALNISDIGFKPFTADSYWSATEASITNALSLNFGDGTTPSDDKTLITARARCIKELVPVLKPIIVEYGKPPYDEVGAILKGFTDVSYYIKYGAGTTTNGAYQANAAAAYLNEKPFYKFEVAREDAYNGTDGNRSWSLMQGTAPDRGDNICVNVHGRDWRIPRLSEMRLIYENRDELNASGKVFMAIAGSYWSATEASGDNAWSINFGDGTTQSTIKSSLSVKVRCVREIYVPTGPVLEWGVAPYDKKGAVTASTKISYNGKYGAGASNGVYQTNENTIYTNEPPYYKFEVAQTDAFDIARPWDFFQGVAADRSDNICEKTHGEGWRIPRVSEMRLIWENKDALNAPGNGFTAITGSYYWTATEGNSTNAWYIDFASGGSTTGGKGYSLNVRCIRELP